MKHYPILTVGLLITLIISACGARGAGATPTVDVVSIQSTMAAAAFTMVAETQAAIPTATPIPPTATFTNTPLPTNTLVPLPSAAGTVAPASAGNSGAGDPCVNQPLPVTLQGETVKIRINNSTKATLALSVYLNQTTPQIVCGYRTYTIEPEQALVLNDLVEGCYTLWAWNPDPKDYFIVTNGAATCIDSSDTAVFDVSTRRIDLR